MPATLLLTDALAESMAQAVAQGVPIETAAAAAGISRTQVYEWIQAADRGSWRDGQPVTLATKTLITAFADQISRAQAIWEAKQVAGITRAAEQVNEKTGQQDWRARAWLLNNHPRTRHTYHEAKELEVTHTEPFLELQKARELSDDALEAEYQRLSLPMTDSAHAHDDKQDPTGAGRR